MSIFCYDVPATDQNVDNIIATTPALQEVFDKECCGVKKIPLSKLWHNDTCISQLTTASKDMIRNISQPRLIDIAVYNKQYKSYSWPNDNQETHNQFNSAKLHWLVNDIKISGLGYPPQGYMKENKFVCHPGTYRFLASYAQQKDSTASVWDTYNQFTDRELQLKEWISYCSDGFIRENRHITIQESEIPEEHQFSSWKFIEINETTNHHDHCIFLQDQSIGEMFNYTIPTVYCKDVETLKIIKSRCDDTSLFNFSTITEPFLIPAVEKFKGISIYIGSKDDVNRDFTSLLLYLDVNDDVAYVPESSIMIFNNSTHNCRKLIPGIVEESTRHYLETFKWSNKVSIIPPQIGNQL
ncbi:hypothetical protein N9C44_01445 [bacterium]|nr:hypothetical protein [bacterium]